MFIRTVTLDGFASDGTDSVDSWVDSAHSWADWGNVADAAAVVRDELGQMFIPNVPWPIRRERELFADGLVLWD